jgi:hypothetical protein
VSESIIDSATPYAFSAEIGPGEPILFERPAKQDEILEVAQDDIVQGIQISLAVGGALVLALWALGQFKYARPNRDEA